MTNKIGNNDPCHCGSGKKYKKCCKAKDEEKASLLVEQEPFVNDPSAADLNEEEYHRAAAGWKRTVNDELDESDEDLSSDPRDKDGLRPKLPPLPAEKQKIVDQWWAEFMPYYKKDDADEMIRRITAFMKEFPELFVYLYLDEECLFELGGELGQRKEWHRYVDLLLQIRSQHEEVYRRSFGYYERDIIIELLLTGRRKEIQNYFTYFKQYPDHYPDCLDEVIRVLVVAGIEAELYDLAEAVAIPLLESPNVFNGDFAADWLIFREYIPCLEKGDFSKAALQELDARLKSLKIADSLDIDLEFIGQELQWALNPPAHWDIEAYKDKKEKIAFYSNVCWNFLPFLHHRKGISWIAAKFLSHQLFDYLTDFPKGKIPAKAFNFNQELIDNYICRRCQNLMWIEGVDAFALLQAIDSFAEYLLAHGQITDPEVSQLKETCLALFKSCLKTVDSTDLGARLYSNFPNISIPGEGEAH